MQKKTIITGLLIFILTGSCFLPPDACAADYIISQYEAVFTPAENLDVSVKLYITYNVKSGTKSDGFKYVGTLPIKNARVTDNRFNPLDHSVKKKKEYLIEWEFPEIRDGEQQEVIVTFIIKDALKGDLAKNTFKAPWVKNWRIPVFDATYRFVFPEGFTPENVIGIPKGELTHTENQAVYSIYMDQLKNQPFSITVSPGFAEEGSSLIGWIIGGFGYFFNKIGIMLLISLVICGFIYILLTATGGSGGSGGRGSGHHGSGGCGGGGGGGGGGCGG